MVLPKKLESNNLSTYYKGQRLVPDPSYLIQDKGTCIFFAIVACGIMQLSNTMFARHRICEVFFNARAFVNAFVLMYGPLDLDTKPRAKRALTLFRDQGIEAYDLSGEPPYFPCNVKIHSFTSYAPVPNDSKPGEVLVYTFGFIASLIEEGNPVLGTFQIPVDKMDDAVQEFEELGDGIYDYWEMRKLYPSNKYISHAVAFVDFGHCEKGRSFLKFLNTNGAWWGKDGFGKIYFDGIPQVDDNFCFHTISYIDTPNCSSRPTSSQANSSQCKPLLPCTAYLPCHRYKAGSTVLHVDMATRRHTGNFGPQNGATSDYHISENSLDIGRMLAMSAPPWQRTNGLPLRVQDHQPSLNRLPMPTDGEMPVKRSEKNVAEPASGQTLHQPVVSSPKNLHYAWRDTIWVREQCDWGITFYTRMNIQRYFHTYPHVGGPFNSLEEVRNAIDRYLHDRQDPSTCKERHEFYEVGKASVERGIRACLYWPDGSKKMHLISEQIDERRCKMLQLVRALMDKYNEDHLLFEDTAFELKDVVRYKVIYDGDCRYYHINFTAKTIGAKTADNLFFAEVIHREDEKLAVCCTYMVDPSDNGHCYGCGSNMKHPNADAYIGGHSKVYKVCHVGDAGPAPNISTAKTMDDWKAEEVRIRRLFEGPDDPSVVARLMKPPKFKFGTIKATDEEVKRFMQSIKAPCNRKCDSTDIIGATAAEKLRATLK